MDPQAWTTAPLFATLKPPQKAALQAMCTSRRLQAGQILFMEGDPCSGFFILSEGAIQLTRVGGMPGAHPTLAMVMPVQSFAEAAMFGDEAFPATATAIQPSRVTHFPKAPFLAAMRSDPDLSLAIVHAQAVWLRKLTQQLERMSSSDSLERLRQWARETLPLKGGFELPMSKKALAAQLGMTPETLSRGLRQLQEQGMLLVEGRVFARGRYFSQHPT